MKKLNGVLKKMEEKMKKSIKDLIEKTEKIIRTKGVQCNEFSFGVIFYIEPQNFESNNLLCKVYAFTTSRYEDDEDIYYNSLTDSEIIGVLPKDHNELEKLIYDLTKEYKNEIVIFIYGEQSELSSFEMAMAFQEYSSIGFTISFDI